MNKGEFFKEVTLRICGSLDIDQAIIHTFDYIRQRIPADAIGLGFSDVSTGRIHVVTKASIAGAQYIWDDTEPSIGLSGESLEYVRTESHEEIPVTIINEYDENDIQNKILFDIFPGLSDNSALFLSLGIHGQEVGALLITAKGRNRYAPQDGRLVQSVREPFTIAMINARRYRELQLVKQRLDEDYQALSTDIKHSLGLEVVGADFGLRDVMEQVRKVAPSASPTLLLGETGTGKEIIANSIHMTSPRNKGPMISMQCGAIPETLLDSELFGHEKGAFTGAAERKRGRFERANGGTLFLDEIGELSMDAQVKLLRVLQEKRFERVGGTQMIEVDVRVIAATHRDLEKMVHKGTFREDLWYRLNVLPIRIPPLRHRREDIPSLVQYFVKRKAREMNIAEAPWVGSEDIDKLRAYDWPGNVREVQNVVERALILSTGGSLHFQNLSTIEDSHQLRVEEKITADRLISMDEAMEHHILKILEFTEGQVAGKGGAAEILKMDPGTLRFRMKKLGITSQRRRSRIS